jgi:hypothetical protein
MWAERLANCASRNAYDTYKPLNKHLVYSFEPKIAEFMTAHINREHHEKCWLQYSNAGMLMYCTSSNDRSGFLPSVFGIQLLNAEALPTSSNSNYTSSLYKMK